MVSESNKQRFRAMVRNEDNRVQAADELIDSVSLACVRLVCSNVIQHFGDNADISRILDDIKSGKIDDTVAIGKAMDVHMKLARRPLPPVLWNSEGSGLPSFQ